MSSWKTLMHKNAIIIVWGVKSVVLLPKIQALFGEKNLGAFFGAFWLNWGASWFKHFSHPVHNWMELTQPLQKRIFNFSSNQYHRFS